MRTLSTPTTTVAPTTIEPVADDYAAVCADAVSGSVSTTPSATMRRKPTSVTMPPPPSTPRPASRAVPWVLPCGTTTRPAIGWSPPRSVLASRAVVTPPRSRASPAPPPSTAPAASTAAVERSPAAPSIGAASDTEITAALSGIDQRRWSRESPRYHRDSHVARRRGSAHRLRRQRFRYHGETDRHLHHHSVAGVRRLGVVLLNLGPAVRIETGNDCGADRYAGRRIFVAEAAAESRCRSETCRGADEVGDGLGSAVWRPGDDGRDRRCVRHRHDRVIVA